MSDTEDLAVTVASLKVLGEYVKTADRTRRDELAASLKRGDRVTARDPRDDAKLASISYTDPNPVVKVNEPVFTAWMAQHYPELCETTTAVAPGMEHEVLRVLFEHAPHLLTRATRVQPEALRELKTACTALRTVRGPGGETEVPGFTVDIPDPVLSCRLADGAHARVIGLVRDGVVEIDGTVRPLIEPAKEEQP